MDEDYAEMMRERGPPSPDDEGWERTPIPHEERFWESRGRELPSRDFYAIFYCTKVTFCKLVKALYGSTAYVEDDGEGRGEFDPCEQVGIFMNRIGSGAGWIQTANFFGVSEQEVAQVTTRVARRVLHILSEEHVAWPDPQEQADISENWELDNSLRKVIGVIDASHIAIPPPPRAHRDKYLNFRQFHSVILTAVVDNLGFFRWVSCDSPGSRRDNAIFRKTQLFRNLQEDQALPRNERTLLADGACILGDTAFAESPWMRTPIPSPSTRREEFFNHKHANQHAIANSAFGRLKWKFQCLDEGKVFNRVDAPLIINACVVLYNFILALDGTRFDADDERYENGGTPGDQTDYDQTKGGISQRRERGEVAGATGGERSARQVETDYLVDAGFLEEEWGSA